MMAARAQAHRRAEARALLARRDVHLVLLPGGKVEVAVVPSGGERVVAGAVWAAWAGEPVEETRDAP